MVTGMESVKGIIDGQFRNGSAKRTAFVYHHSNGWIGANLGVPMVLIYTIGAKTGFTRMVPLQYYSCRDRTAILVLASNNGQTKPPAWYFQSESQPGGRDPYRAANAPHVRAEELSSERRTEVWPAMRTAKPEN